ncbi:MAG: hypothetical protein Q8O19_07385 [Rectinemataceae bacterium]|nr:hypothetical protein [Rectinemataceae bacterium]
MLATQIEGKKFLRNSSLDTSKEFGKFIFSEKVIKTGKGDISFDGFVPFLDRLVQIVGASGKLPDVNRDIAQFVYDQKVGRQDD